MTVCPFLYSVILNIGFSNNTYIYINNKISINLRNYSINLSTVGMSKILPKFSPLL